MLRTAIPIAVISTLIAQAVLGHGDAAPQAVDTTGLPTLPSEMATQNPWREADAELMMAAVSIGGAGYNSNCARCHGLEAISGGLAPDLRYLEADEWGDEWYLTRVSHGAEQNGAAKMPPLDNILSQEAIWAIRTYVETRPDDQEFVARKSEIQEINARIEALKSNPSQAAEVADALFEMSASFEAASGAPKSVTALDEAGQLLKSDPPRVEAALDAMLGILRN